MDVAPSARRLRACGSVLIRHFRLPTGRYRLIANAAVNFAGPKPRTAIFQLDFVDSSGNGDPLWSKILTQIDQPTGNAERSIPEAAFEQSVKYEQRNR